MADVKGDLTGVAEEGQASEKLLARLKNIGITDWQPHANPVTVWDIFGEKGHPVRATVSDLGPLLLARLLNLNDVQSGVLDIIFRIADDQVCCCSISKTYEPLPSTSAITPNPSRISMAISAAPRSGQSSVDCCRWSNRGRRTSLANRCWTSKTGCELTPAAKG